MTRRRFHSAKKVGIADRHFRCREMSNRNSNSNNESSVFTRLTDILLLILLITLLNENELIGDTQ